MKVSARNRFEGVVESIHDGGVNAEVLVRLASGASLASVVSMQSVEALGLQSGSPVLALVKAPWVMLMREGRGDSLSARNVLSGTVKEVLRGPVNSEVVVRLDGGAEVTSIVTKEAVAELSLEPGAAVSAIIKASNVVLGVPA